MKVLVMRLSSIGDVLLTTPVVRCLKRQLEGVELHYLTRGVNGEFLKYNPYIDRLILLGESMDDTIECLRSEKYDYIIDLHNNHRTRHIRTALGVKHSVYRKENGRKFLYVITKVDVMSGKSVVDRYMKAVEPLGVHPDKGGLEIFLSPELEGGHLPEPLDKLVDEPFVALACGGQHATKRLPIDKIGLLCSSLPMRVLLLGDASDSRRIEESGVEFGPNVTNLCGKTSLQVSAAIVRRAAAVVTSDSSMLHIAAAYARPVVTIWGATSPSFGFAAYRTNSVDCEVKGLWCRPCSRMGGERCIRGNYKCMNGQDWNKIADTVKQLVSDNQKT